MTMGKSSRIILASAALSMAWLPLTAYAASSGPVLQASAETASIGQTIQYTVQDSQATSSTEYQFWIETPSGQWKMAQSYSANPHFILPHVQAGSYEVVAYALSRQDVEQGDWAKAMATAPDSLYVNATVSVKMMSEQGASGPAEAVTVATSNVSQPVYQLWWKTPSGVWQASGPYQSNPNFSVPLTENGAYQFVAYAKSIDSPATSAQTMASSTQSLMNSNVSIMHTIQKVASTVDATNGDSNPYGLTYDSFAGTSAAPNPYYGDLLVSNFSNAAGAQGAGTTIEAINPQTGSVKTFSSDVQGADALAVSPKGPLWVADFGTMGTNGNVMVLTPGGGVFPNGGSEITGSNLDGPWGQAFVPNPTTPAFFVTNALNGTVDAMYGFAPPNFNTDTHFMEIGSGLAHSGSTASTIEGPQGMVYDPMTHMVYVTDTADNSIRAYEWTGANTPNQGQGQLIYQGGALMKPAGITLDPLNGDLLVVNQGNNNLVEIALNNGHAYVAGQKVLDNTPVNPKTGAGSALFGVDAVASNGHLFVYYTDDNTNTVNVLE
ncbi:MAG: hypothetical protein C7B44_13895 [Sulfobacillus thermosulfidooxidans]|nr:MAG: hypothetical protein C7B44_13895 [Sulfobacillus thermosulfidooxidans]